MKSLDFSCKSPASTAICSSMDQRAMVRHGTRSMDRRRHHISDRRKPKNIPLVPCTSQLPINPKTYIRQIGRKSTSATATASASISDKKNDQLVRRKSSADINDLTTTPHGSSRYLLSDKPLKDLLFLEDTKDENLLALVPSEPIMPRSLSSNDSILLNPNSPKMIEKERHDLRPRRVLSSNDALVLTSFNKQLVASQLPNHKPSHLISSTDTPALKSSTARSRSRSPYQVVELMVSIHCKGCEGKVRKHISRMEGVTSFSIDRATKKVIVVGDITPLGVLTSISRVKNAQFWPSPSSSSSSSSTTSSAAAAVVEQTLEDSISK